MGKIKQYSYKGYYLYIKSIDSIFNDWYAGYIEIPKEHPIYGRHCAYIDIPIHGGWTYNEPYLGNKKDSWFIGFDTAHSFDDETTRNEEYVLSELHKAIDEMEEHYTQ